MRTNRRQCYCSKLILLSATLPSRHCQLLTDSSDKLFLKHAAVFLKEEIPNGIYTGFWKWEKIHSHQNLSLRQWCEFMIVNWSAKAMMATEAEVWDMPHWHTYIRSRNTLKILQLDAQVRQMGLFIIHSIHAKKMQRGNQVDYSESLAYLENQMC